MLGAQPTIKTETFEGPIELLLQLIQERKLPINEVSLSKVTDDYISQIRSLDSLPVAQVTQFLVVAATLLVIKSKSLLPLLQLSDEEEDDIHELEHRLAIYKLYTDVSAHIEQRFGVQVSFERSYVPQEIAFVPDTTITLESLHDSLRGVLQSFPEKQPVLAEERVQVVVHLEKVMDDLIQRVEQGMQISFSEMTDKVRSAKSHTEYKKAKTYAVVGFLAMLEMVKNGVVDVLQDTTFNDIAISKRTS